MQAQILSMVGRVAGLAGLAIGVLLLIFTALLKLPLIPTGGLSQAQAYALTLAVVVFTFGIAGIGLLAWLVAPKGATATVPMATLALMAILFVAVLLCAVFVSTQVNVSTSTVSSENTPNSQDLPLPPQAPSRPIDGRWDLQLLCPDTSAVNEAGANFVGGRYARSFTGPVNGTTELALGYASAGTVKLSGYVAFEGNGTFSVEATGTKSGSTISGTGKFGTQTGCKLTGTAK